MLYLAQTQTIENPLKVNDFQSLLQTISSGLFTLAIPVAVVMYIYAGVLFLISRGDPSKTVQAKKVLLYTTIGLVVIFIGSGFIDLIKSVLNAGA